MAEDQPEDQATDRSLKALRQEGRDVYHYCIGGEPVCDMAFNPENTQYIGEIDAAEQFFDLCDTCDESYDEEFEMVLPEIRQEIALACGFDMARPETAFNKAQIKQILRTLLEHELEADDE